MKQIVTLPAHLIYPTGTIHLKYTVYKLVISTPPLFDTDILPLALKNLVMKSDYFKKA